MFKNLIIIVFVLVMVSSLPAQNKDRVHIGLGLQMLPDGIMPQLTFNTFSSARMGVQLGFATQLMPGNSETAGLKNLGAEIGIKYTLYNYCDLVYGYRFASSYPSAKKDARMTKKYSGQYFSLRVGIPIHNKLGADQVAVTLSYWPVATQTLLKDSPYIPRQVWEKSSNDFVVLAVSYNIVL